MKGKHRDQLSDEIIIYCVDTVHEDNYFKVNSRT